MMHLPGQLQWDCKTIKSCHKRLHLLMSATSINSITVVTHLLKSFKFLCLTSYVGFDKLRGTDEKNCVSTYKICQGMGKKKTKNSTAAKNVHYQNNNPAPSKNMENWYNKYNNVKKINLTMVLHINGFICICLMLKSIRILGILISTMWRKIGLEELSPCKAHSIILKTDWGVFCLTFCTYS